MTLSEYVASKKRSLFQELQDGADPSEGAFNADQLREARLKGNPQMGTARFEPHAVVIEFIFADGRGATAVVPITLPSPERIVFLPVPGWVIESIWQGDIDGSFHFESDAQTLVQTLLKSLEPVENAGLFAAKAPTRRE